MILLGIALGIGAWLFGATFIAAKQNRDALKAAAEARTRAEAEEESKKSQPMKYKPLGNKMKKPVFLPTEADSLLQEDPMIEWQPVQLGETSAYMNPETGEVVELGQEKNLKKAS